MTPPKVDRWSYLQDQAIILAPHTNIAQTLYSFHLHWPVHLFPISPPIFYFLELPKLTQNTLNRSPTHFSLLFLTSLKVLIFLRVRTSPNTTRETVDTLNSVSLLVLCPLFFISLWGSLPLGHLYYVMMITLNVEAFYFSGAASFTSFPHLWGGVSCVHLYSPEGLPLCILSCFFDETLTSLPAQRDDNKRLGGQRSEATLWRSNPAVLCLTS